MNYVYTLVNCVARILGIKVFKVKEKKMNVSTKDSLYTENNLERVDPK